jgi:hypothetical protein
MTDDHRSEASIGLAELIAAVRSELEKADASRIEQVANPLLELREVELEIQFEVTRARSGKGVDFHVVAPGDSPTGEGEVSRVQKLRVLYGPTFKLVELHEGEGSTAIPDWLRASTVGQGEPSA